MADMLACPAATYTLEAMAANEDGVWSQNVASVRVVVEPAPWQTWWAWLLYGRWAWPRLGSSFAIVLGALREQVRAAHSNSEATPLIDKLGEGGMGVVYRA